MTDVLAAIDFSRHSGPVLRAAGTLAAATGGCVHLLHAAAEEPAFVGYDPADEVAQFTPEDRLLELVAEHEELRRMADEVRDEGVEVVPRLVMGPTVEVILAEAETAEAGWIVVGSHGRGSLYHLLAGSVTEGLVRQSTRPIVVVPAEKD